MSGIFSRRVPVILQSEAPECGIACLAMVASFHGYLTDLSAMRVRLSPSLKGITLKNIAQIAEGMIAAEDIGAKNGVLIIPKGQAITRTLLQGLKNFSTQVGVVEPVRVQIGAAAAASASTT